MRALVVLATPSGCGRIVKAALRRTTQDFVVHNGPMADILVVEDDAPIAQLLADHLLHARHAVRIEREGIAAIASFLDNGADLVVLDVMLPGASGYDVC